MCKHMLVTCAFSMANRSSSSALRLERCRLKHRSGNPTVQCP
jgi:hypothetical protein